MALKIITGIEAYMMRLPMPDLARWPSWIRKDPRSCFDESAGITKDSP
jgi:hypothetical protein